ncbi:hypothetical protein AP3564_11925 [Aeribacillus pallidus]|uniref:Major facilitator superfamily (MFS) profile domain-containing protein n=1 Tax=Aeribacillus pallidus TaxID=33936 RepID=A0A223E6I0_9BACI|nr:hypothetical protein AP3564_11925 [Aeribacillus pallidus]
MQIIGINAVNCFSFIPVYLYRYFGQNTQISLFSFGPMIFGYFSFANGMFLLSVLLLLGFLLVWSLKKQTTLLIVETGAKHKIN